MLSLQSQIFISRTSMEKIKNIFNDILQKMGFGANGGLDLKTHWKIVIYIYLTLFAVLVVFGWLFYSWIIQTEVIPPKIKNNRTDITSEELNRAKILSEGRKDKLDNVIRNDVTATNLK